MNQTLKGFRDFGPEIMTIRSEAISRVRKIFKKYGFEELQTPALEYQEVLLGKYGEEAEKLMYLFNDPGGRPVGMKYDLTVPLARYVAQNQNTPMPFKRFQIQPVWRADKPQKGRYREFYQCDIDTVGSSSPLSDAEILAVISEVLEDAFGFSKFSIKINSRPVLFEAMKVAQIKKPNYNTVIQSIDKLDKKTRDDVEQELVQKGVSKKQIKAVFKAISNAQPDDYLQEVMDMAKQMKVKKLEFIPTLARGLDYYTGPIFETVVDKPNIGSITGGGRYDKLLGELGGPDLPAVGTTIGLDRAVDVITELELWNDLQIGTKVLVTIFDKKLLDKSLETANLLRDKNINITVFPDPKTDLKRQLKYADKKQIPYVVVIGPDEAKDNKVRLKNMNSGKQETINLQELVAKLA